MRIRLSVIHALAFSIAVPVLLSVSVAHALEFTGAVEFRSKVAISALGDGVVTAVHVEAGDVVKQGDVLVEFDSRSVESKITIQKSRVTRLQVVVKQAKDELFRLEEMYDRGSLSQVDLDHAREALEIARADFAEAEAHLEIARLELEKTRLTAPFDSIVESTDGVNIGTSFRTTDQQRASVNLAKLGEYAVRSSINLDERKRLKKGTNATVIIGDRVYPAVVNFVAISPISVEGTNAQYSISVVFTVTDEQILPGRIAAVTIETEPN